MMRSQASIRPRHGAVGARQRLGDRRVVAQEGRLEDLRLDQLGQQLEEDLVLVPGGVERDVVRGGIPAQGLHGRVDGDLSPTASLTAS
jgi:hypothetical protein